MTGKLTKSELTRQRILDAAAKVFRSNGYSGARLSDIAALAGIQTGSMYYHFDSREALVEEVLHLGIAVACEHAHDRAGRVREQTQASFDLTPVRRQQ
jgi:AcrR family transcriptional regulator